MRAHLFWRKIPADCYWKNTQKTMAQQARQMCEPHPISRCSCKIFKIAGWKNPALETAVRPPKSVLADYGYLDVIAHGFWRVALNRGSMNKTQNGADSLADDETAEHLEVHEKRERNALLGLHLVITIDGGLLQSRHAAVGPAHFDKVNRAIGPQTELALVGMLRAE